MKISRIALVIFIFLTALAAHSLKAQEATPKQSTTLSLVKNHIGWGIRLDQTLKWNRHQATAGIKFGLKSNPVDDSQKVLWNRSYPNSFPEMWGLNLGYAFEFFKFKHSLSLSAFYDAQLSRCSMLIYKYNLEGIGIYLYTQTIEPIFSNRMDTTRAITALEQNMGLQIAFDISRRLSIVEKTGMGIAIAKTNALSSNGSNHLYLEMIRPFALFGLAYKWN